jgi:HK97 family phage portal protein
MNFINKISSLFKTKALQTVPNTGGGWFPVVSESFGGAWQQGAEVSKADMLSHGAVYACVSLIASDIGKLPISITQNANGIWLAVDTDHSRLFRTPNSYQNRAQFFSAWIVSKLLNGNAYAFKVRDAYGRVIGLKLLDPQKVKILVAEDDSVFYQINGGSTLQRTGEVLTIPAREIIHDRGICLHHPLVGVSPITAAALAAGQGMAIQKASAQFFANGQKAGGLLTAPGAISDEVAARLKSHWDTKYAGDNAGKTAVLGDGLHFEPMTITAVDSQLLEQLQFTDKQVCTAFGVPAWKIGIGEMPTYNGSEAGQLHYYQTTIQSLLEQLELCLDIGLELPASQRTEFDTNELLRLDTATRFDSYAKAIGAGWMAPNEARQREGLSPVKGGESPLIQQQNFSLAALAKRDAQEVQA